MKQAFLFALLLLAVVPLAACGIPKDAYETAIKERDAAQTELKQIKSEVQIKGSTSPIAVPSSSLAPKIALAEQVLVFDSTRAKAARSRNELKDEAAAQKLEATALTIFKSFDPLVKEIGDSELSKAWAETWPPAARQQAEKDNRPGYIILGWIKFLDRLTVLLKDGRNRLMPR